MMAGINIGAPEGIYLVLQITSLALAMLSEKRGPAAFALAFWVFVTLPLLYWGGFFE